MKIVYVMGWMNAASYSDDKYLQSTISSDPTYGEYRKGIDELCAVPKNAIIPVHVMIATFTRKFQGVAASLISSDLEFYRKFYSHPPEVPPVPPAPQQTGGKK